jgi:protein-S-isoprenylcysteine O-methyltransferase Ste14
MELAYPGRRWRLSWAIHVSALRASGNKWSLGGTSICNLKSEMESETPFRIAVLLILLLSMSVGSYYRWRAAAGGRVSHREEGYLFAIVLRLGGLCVWISVLAYLVAPASVAWAALPLPTWLRWCGVPIGALGPPLMYWTLSSLGRNLTDTVVTRPEATLVTRGPYRWVRHPFYVTAAVLMLSVTLLSANALIGASAAAVLLLLALRTPKEEQMLVARFGDDYRQYMARTGRFFPRRSSRR